MNFKPFAAALLLAAAIPALAQTAVPTAPLTRIEQREANQQKRIEQGEKSGALTPREAGRLERGQARVEKMEQKAGADGKISGREARRIEHAQDQQNKAIARERNDKQRAK